MSNGYESVFKTHGQTDLGGTSRGPGFSVNWQHAGDHHGARPEDLVRAARDRLVHLQKTTSGGNETAQKLWALEKCYEQLEEINRAAGTGGSVAPGAGLGSKQEGQ